MLEQKLASQTSYSSALDTATAELESVKEKLAETETLLATEKQKIVDMGEKLESEKRWHSETLLKLNEVSI